VQYRPVAVTSTEAAGDLQALSPRDLKQEVDSLKRLHEMVKTTMSVSEPWAFAFCALLVVKRELSEIRRSIDSASRRYPNR
jgi:hypothetical protein